MIFGRIDHLRARAIEALVVVGALLALARGARFLNDVYAREMDRLDQAALVWLRAEEGSCLPTRVRPNVASNPNRTPDGGVVRREHGPGIPLLCNDSPTSPNR